MFYSAFKWVWRWFSVDEPEIIEKPEITEKDKNMIDNQIDNYQKVLKEFHKKNLEDINTILGNI